MAPSFPVKRISNEQIARSKMVAKAGREVETNVLRPMRYIWEDLVA